jgi:hypothetical protein
LARGADYAAAGKEKVAGFSFVLMILILILILGENGQGTIKSTIMIKSRI